MITNYDDYRKIIHIDMDAFYASVEQRDNPELKGKPIAVGGGEKRGVTTTASYEARKFGVKSAMPGWKARELCPDLIFVKPRFEAYKQVSNQIRAIFKRYTDLIEPLSLDEAYLDVTNNKINQPIATEVAKAIKKDIFTETQLTASAGVSYCKFIAKIASDIQKPNGLTVIKPHQALNFLETLPIQKFFGVGKVTAGKMTEMGITNGLDLKAFSKMDLVSRFGKNGAYYYDMVRGIDDRPVEPFRIRKSIAVETTFDEYLNEPQDLFNCIDSIAQELFLRIVRSNFQGKTLTLKIKNKTFQQWTRSISQSFSFDNLEQINSFGKSLVNQNLDLCVDVRLIGLTVSNPIIDEPKVNGQLELPFE
ncbi:MAG TPA: DNA polymerase IV [Saprospiraceae bacterium]|nr:DNA polymerase IV [Saprospiraceae bacterium]HPN69239.1 DNA polymerase IV [Saprospiraceae bacterium]